VPQNLHLLPKFSDRMSYLYVEHAVVERDQNSISLWQETEETGLTKTQIPVCDIALVLLGPGTKVSHSAIDILARNNCLVAWTGEEGVRMYAFGTGGTHSSSRLLHQVAHYENPEKQIHVVRKLYSFRFPEALEDDVTVEQLRGKEGYRVREIYRQLADQHGIEWQGRSYDRNHWQGSDTVNRALSAANACLYGVCHAAILSMGFSPALGFIHRGKQLSFVYDIADLYKFETSVPVSFACAAESDDNVDRRVRMAMRDSFKSARLLERVAKDLNILFETADIETETLDEDAALPGELVGGVQGGQNYAEPEKLEGSE
jgi:CRISP-associated protein Cas1